MNNDFKLNIKGQEWKIRILSGSAYTRKYGVESKAFANLDTKTIVYNKNDMTPGIIRHELLHALLDEAHIESALLTSVQVEEMCASIIQYHWNNINLWTELILDEALRGKQ